MEKRGRLLVSIICILAPAMTGCPGSSDKGSPELPMENNSLLSSARGFDLRVEGDFRVLKVFDPWQDSQGVTYTYILGEKGVSIPDSLSPYPFIAVPVKKVVVMSTTHLAFIGQLGRENTIHGISGTGYVYDPRVVKEIEAGRISEIGSSGGIDYERIVEIGPDVVFSYGVEGTEVAVAEKLKEMGIQVVFCGEYLEPDPLGKAEWIKFFAEFYGMREEAGSKFGTVDSAYASLLSLTEDLDDRPRILTGLPWKDTWYMAGGKSHAAKLIEDAGGEYLWKENTSREAIPLDMESVYSRALTADIWINPGAARSISELEAFDHRFRDLPALLNRQVFNRDRRMGSGGGNDYWESGTVRPDLVLMDLIRVFHPDLLADHQFVYYRKLK